MEKKPEETIRDLTEPAIAYKNKVYAGDDAALSDVIASYLTYCATRNKPRTISLKRTYLRRFVDFIGNAPLRDIKCYHVEDFMSHRALKGNAPANNRTLTVLKHFFNFAARRDLVERNPCRGIKGFPEKRKPIKILGEDELQTYFDYCRANDPLLYDLSAVAFGTGLRRGDILKIRGGDVDGGRRTLTVQVSKRNGELTLHLPLNGWVFAVLSRRKDEYGDGYLFSGRNGSHVVDFKRRFARAKRATGVEFRFGEFRHNCATALLRAGVNVYVVKELLGHTSVNTTARYLKLLGDDLRAAVDKLDTDVVRGAL
jgi:integrase